MKKVLTIAGSDCSGGAGIQADIKTITAHKLYAMSAITALTAQNTSGVYGIMEVTPDFLASQLDCIFQDIVPDAVKIGMVSGAGLIEVIAAKLQEYKAVNIVADPVMISTSGSSLLAADAADVLIHKLLPMADVITPNIPEAEALSGMLIKTEEDMVRAARIISEQIPGAILVKGGHNINNANDMLYQNSNIISELCSDVCWYKGERIDNSNTHGTGCTLSSAIACNLALGYSLSDSISNAKEYISGALRANLNLGRGSGPLDHTFAIDGFRGGERNG